MGKLEADRLERRPRVEHHGAVLADLFLRRDPSAWDDLRGAATGGNASIGVGSDDQEPTRIGREWQQALVTQQNDPFARDGERRPLACGEVDWLRSVRAVGEPMRED